MRPTLRAICFVGALFLLLVGLLLHELNQVHF
jgi:hypothetical protein